MVEVSFEDDKGIASLHRIIMRTVQPITRVYMLCVAFINILGAAGIPKIHAVIAMESGVSKDTKGVVIIKALTDQKLRLVGEELQGNSTTISFTPSIPSSGGSSCTSLKRSHVFDLKVVDNDGHIADSTVNLEEFDPGEENYYVCLRNAGEKEWTFQGSDPWLKIKVSGVTTPNILPTWLQWTTVAILLLLSGLFSGLNLGLMALDITDLQIIEKAGNESEQKYARQILPVRRYSNFLLCTLLLGNVLVNTTATMLLGDLIGSGVMAVVVSSALLVLFGEIIPQAICSQHGLAVGARTLWITKIFMIITSPISFPVAKILDKLLGNPLGEAYDKGKLLELIHMTADKMILKADEANIVSGALQFSEKTVEEVMTKVEDVYMLEMDSILDFDLINDILENGFTRVPVYSESRHKIEYLLNAKELAVIDPRYNTPLKTVCQFYSHHPLYVDYDMTLSAMLKEFLTGREDWKWSGV